MHIWHACRLWVYACFSPKPLVKKSSSGGNSSSGNSSSESVFGWEVVFGAQFVFGEFVSVIRLRVGIRLRGAIRLRGIRLRNSSSEFVFVCGWKCLTRTAGAMYIYIYMSFTMFYWRILTAFRFLTCIDYNVVVEELYFGWDMRFLGLLRKIATHSAAKLHQTKVFCPVDRALVWMNTCMFKPAVFAWA